MNKMDDKFKNRYRIPSARLHTWDYGTNGAYFITICTKHREHFFGDIVNDFMKLNVVGELVDYYWKQISENFPFIQLDKHVVMPNHMHGILMIEKPVETRFIASSNSSSQMSPIQSNVSIKSSGGITGGKNPMLNENISKVLRWYKGKCSKEIHKINPEFEWQSRFHDHIIRNPEEFERIKFYIENNPKNWNKDKFNE